MSLKTKNVFLTGGAAGLGKAYMERLLQAGAKVVFGDLNDDVGKATLSDFSEKYGAENVSFVKFDVTNKEQFEEAFKTAVSTLGFVDLMVNNAGIMNESAWELMVTLNYAGVIRGTYLAMEHMRQDKGGKGGRIINISSIFGLEPVFVSPVYAGTKHAVRAFTSSLAMAPDREALGIEYAVLCPGPADTALCTELDKTKINFYDLVINDLQMASTAIVAQGFMNLVTLDFMNNAIYHVDRTGMEFQKLERKDISWPPEEVAAEKKDQAEAST